MLVVLLLGALAPEAVVATVGTEKIAAQAVSARVAQNRDHRYTPERALDLLIGEAVLAQEGYRAGLDRDANVVAAVESERRRVAGDLFLSRGLTGITATDEELREVYHQGADEVKLRMVVRATRDDAKAALDRLARGASLAEEALSSLDPSSKMKKGEVGWMKRAELQPAMADVVYKAALNTWSGPIELKDSSGQRGLGFAVLQVTERRMGDDAGFASRRDTLRPFVIDQKRRTARAHITAMLRAKTTVTIDEAFIKSTGTSLDGDATRMDHVVAKIGSRAIRYRDLVAAVLQMFPSGVGGHGGTSAKSEMVSSLADQAVVEEAAIAAGLDKSPEAVAAGKRLEHGLVGQAYVTKIASAVPAPAAAEVDAWYVAHAKRCGHILMRDKGEADKLRKRVGKETFEALAKQNSLDALTRDKGGLLGDFTDARIDSLATQMQMPEFAQAIRDAKPGEVSAPVKSPMGYHVVRCSALEAGTRPPQETRATVEAELLNARRLEAIEARVKDLRARATVNIDKDALKRAAASAK